MCEDYFELSPVEHARKRLAMMNEQDMIDQKRIIAQSLQTVNPEIHSETVSSARAVYDLLETHAIDSNPCGWVGLDMDNRGRAFFQSIGFDLYDGLLGVLCFYAALYEATGDETIRSALEKRYAPYRSLYVTGGSVPARADTVNLTHGLGGHILALTYISRCLGDVRFIKDAVKLFRRFDFHGDFDFADSDVYGGAAGLLIALPALLGQGIDGELRAAAAQFADGISRQEPSLTGFGHGAAGIAAALACAQTVLDARRYEADILRILRAENALYDADACNWPDLRDPEKHGFMHGLCAGVPGIGLARKMMLQQNIGEEIRAICIADIEKVKAYYEQPRVLKRDSLCCGNAARIACERGTLGRIPQSALNAEPVFYHPLNTNDFPAGLMQGWAGVGYALVRSLPESKSDLFV